MIVKFKKLHPDAKMPTLATPGSACWDLYALESIIVINRERLRTGLAVELPQGYMLDIRPRSGLAARGLIISNAPGTVDEDYRGELAILVHTVGGPIDVVAGNRVAQCRLVPISHIEWEEVEELSETSRGSGGFGSTGR